jgi:hypothetical protein
LPRRETLAPAKTRRIPTENGQTERPWNVHTVPAELERLDLEDEGRKK